ncbi:MAG: hypothetical protein HYT16_02905 [DPANN group archaeon]|nr:hypothetical protein [DPANN group archaeon]
MSGEATYVFTESPQLRRFGTLRTELGEIIYAHYVGRYPDGRLIPGNHAQNFVVVPGIVMRRAGLEERVYDVRPIPITAKAAVRSTISLEIKVPLKDVEFVFW